MLGPGFAGFNAKVDQAGAEDASIAVDCIRSTGDLWTDIGDHAVFDDQSASFIKARFRIDEASVGQYLSHRPSPEDLRSSSV